MVWYFANKSTGVFCVLYLYIHRALLSLICHYAIPMVESGCNEPSLDLLIDIERHSPRRCFHQTPKPNRKKIVRGAITSGWSQIYHNRNLSPGVQNLFLFFCLLLQRGIDQKCSCKLHQKSSSIFRYISKDVFHRTTLQWDQRKPHESTYNRNAQKDSSFSGDVGCFSMR